jgi:uncharacterized protein YejL (UPF0352 family)
MATTRKRSKAIKLTVTPELYDKLQEVAAAYGQPPSTLASVLLGQVVANALITLHTSRVMGQALAEQMGNAMRDSVQEATK